MKRILTPLVWLLALLLSSCYISLPESSDPAMKLEEASRYLEQGQPLPAERLIMEAMQAYQTQNDPEGLGNAYRNFGLFLRSPAIAQRERTYREAGFLDHNITYDNRMEKSGEYLEKAMTQYNEAATRYQNQGNYGQLSTLYYDQAGVYLLQNNKTMACSTYDQSRKAYAESAVRNTEKPEIPKGYASFHDAITAAKNQAGCP